MPWPCSSGTAPAEGHRTVWDAWDFLSHSSVKGSCHLSVWPFFVPHAPGYKGNKMLTWVKCSMWVSQCWGPFDMTFPSYFGVSVDKSLYFPGMFISWATETNPTNSGFLKAKYLRSRCPCQAWWYTHLYKQLLERPGEAGGWQCEEAVVKCSPSMLKPQLPSLVLKSKQNAQPHWSLLGLWE